MSDSDILDRIDALVDEQLQQEASGYDHNINQDRCWHCNGEWHGLAITELMKTMRRRGVMDEDYRYNEDDSPVYCPGSRFIGPRKPTTYEGTGSLWAIPEDVFDPASWLGTLPTSPWVVFRSDTCGDIAIHEWTVSIGDARLPVAAPEPEPEPEGNPERWEHFPPLPRPSRRPPMWAARPDGRRR